MPRRPLLVALALYAALVSVLLLWPTPVDQPVAGLLARVIGALQGVPLLEWVTYERVEFGANIAMFVPLGLLGALALPPRLALLPIGLAAAASVGFEVVQSLALSARFGSVVDVVANTTGAAIGVLCSFVPALRRSAVPRAAAGAE